MTITYDSALYAYDSSQLTYDGSQLGGNMPTLPLMTANSYFGLAAETTYGTPVSITTMTPVGSPKVTPGVVWLDDSDFRGSPVMHYDQVQGVFKATYDAKTFTYTDVYPNLLRAALGSADTVASVGPSLWTHTIGLQNQANTGSQSPSYTIINDSVDATYQLAASRLVSLDVSFAADAAVENTFQFASNQPTAVASVSASPSSVQHLIPAWNCAASIGGTAVTVVESVDLNIKRNTSQIYTLGSQSAVSNFQGPIEVSGKFTFVIQQGQNYWANALVRDQQQVLLALVDPQTNYQILYQMSNVQLESPVVDQSKNYVQLTTDFIGVANTTDAVVANSYSPILCVVKNGISTAY